MKVSPILSTVFIPRAGEPSATFQIGEILAATVLEKLSDNHFLLQLSQGGRRLHAESSIELDNGQELQLEVIKAGETVELRVVKGDSSADGLAEIEQQAYRQLLPKQQSLSVLIEHLLQTMSAENNHRLPGVVQEAIRQLLNVLPDAAGLTPEKIKQAILASGVFLEAMLGQSPQQPLVALPDDFKAKLLRLFDALKSVQPVKGSLAEPTERSAVAPSSDGTADGSPEMLAATLLREAQRNLKDLLENTESALAKVALDQLASLPRVDGEQAWQLELPFCSGRGGDSVRLRITEDRNASAGDAGAPRWSVLLELNPPGLGEIHCRINIVGERVDAFFVSQDALTANLILVNLNLLDSRFRQAGLEPAHLDAQAGSLRRTAP